MLVDGVRFAQAQTLFLLELQCYHNDMIEKWDQLKFKLHFSVGHLAQCSAPLPFLNHSSPDPDFLTLITLTS